MLGNFKRIDNKIVIRLRDKICETPEELVQSKLFKHVLGLALQELLERQSVLLDIFAEKENKKEADTLIQVFSFLCKIPLPLVSNVVPDSSHLTEDADKLNDLLQYIYNYWREFDRFVICSSRETELDRRPLQTFRNTVEQLAHMVRQTYRIIQENITGVHPNIYRQVTSGAEFAAITADKGYVYTSEEYSVLNNVNIIRQLLLFPPLVINQSMNKRTGAFVRTEINPLSRMREMKSEEWICYPAKVGSLVIYVYVHESMYELGFSLANLFELGEEHELENREPDAILLCGIPDEAADTSTKYQTVFYEDPEYGVLVGAIPRKKEFGYFGYLKKMILTLHNIIVMKNKNMPFHGAMAHIITRGNKAATVLIIGDTGAGKSETLEALRVLGKEDIQDIIVIADDMGSLQIDEEGNVVGYGTEIGAFLRLDDLNTGYAFGQMDRAIIMNPSQTNARIILPVTKYNHIVRGFKVDIVLYCNNYEEVDEDNLLIERFDTPEAAINVFRAGAVMSKGTTTTTGLVHSYYANVFGPPSYKSEHDEIARRFFHALSDKGVFVGQMRTRLSISGCEQTGPEEAAQALLALIKNK